MSKNSTETQENRRSTDGKISTEDLSPTLTSQPDGTGGMGSNGSPQDPRQVVIDLADVNLEVLDSLREGMGVTFQTRRRTEVITEKGSLIGYVRSEDTKKVSSLLAINFRASISSLYHKGIKVRIEAGT